MCFLSLCARTLETTTQEAWVSLVVYALGEAGGTKPFLNMRRRGMIQQRGDVPFSGEAFSIRPVTNDSKHHRRRRSTVGQPSFTVASVDPNFHSQCWIFPRQKEY